VDRRVSHRDYAVARDPALKVAEALLRRRAAGSPF
jgi:hypothetical protein